MFCPAIMPMVLALSSCSTRDRKSTRLNSSHSQISYAVFCLKKKKKIGNNDSVRKLSDRVRRHLAPARPGDHGHPRIVPALHITVFDQLDQMGRQQDGVVHV